jgi:hydrogenase nickel incorporation protein HypB
MMCTTCGCGNGEARVEGKPIGKLSGEAPAGAPSRAEASGYRYVRLTGAAGNHAHARERSEHGHLHADGTWHSHSHIDEPAARRPIPDAAAEAVTSDAAASASRILAVERDLLAKNDAIAAANRRFLDDRGAFAVNLVSSPGSGKTTLLVKTIEAWRDRTRIAVIEGDQQTSRDADRVRAAGAHAIQVNTGKGCHLDAQMVANALERLALADDSLLLIENVGNLVCPAAFDLGEAHKVVILSVTEGDDKPLKYPDMFRAASLLVLNKIDLLPHVEFDVEAAIGYARRVRPGIEAILVSARTGEGFADWIDWLERGTRAAASRRSGVPGAPHRRIAAGDSDLREPAT